MSRRLVPALIATSLAALLAACGSGSTGDVSGIDPIQGANCRDVQFSGSGTADKLIVSDLPLQGDSAERSAQMNDAIVQEIARKGWDAGTTEIAFQACDDSIASTGEWDPATCRGNAQAYAANADVIGVIGTYNSGCAQIEIPILNRAAGGGVPMVSPGNTLVCLTEASPALCQPKEPGVYYPSGKRNYVRVVPNDAVQGAGLATFAKEEGIKRPYVLYAAGDPTSAGQARAFEGAAQSLGLLLRGAAQWHPEANDFTVVMRKVRASGADGLVLAGLLEQHGAQLIKDKVAVLGPNTGAVKLLAFDGFAQQVTIDQAGPSSAGMFVSLPGRVPSSLGGEGSAFVKEVKAQIGHKPVEVFAPYAGQAAEVLMAAIQAGEATRAGTISSLFKIHVDQGIVGTFAITRSGDPSPAPISVSVAGPTFTLAKTIGPPPQLVAAARGG